MKKKYQKILGFLFFFSIFFSFGNNAFATACSTDKDCPTNYECKLEGYYAKCKLKTTYDPNSTENSPEANLCQWKYISSESPEVCPGEKKVSDGFCPKDKPSTNIYSSVVCCCPNDTITKPTKTPDLNPLGNLQVKIPGLDELAKKHPAECSTDPNGKTSCSIPWIAIYIKAIYNYFLYIGGIIAVIALMIGGIIWLVSAGNASRISEAKSWIIGSVTGIVILLSSYILLYQINPNLVNQKTLNLESIEPIEVDNSFDDTAENPYLQACLDAKSGNLNTCKNLGEKRPSGVSLISGNIYANQDVYQKYKQAINCVKSKNGNKELFSISSAWRSPAGQIKAKEDWTKKGNPENAATPCCSNHGSGRAFDLKRIDGKEMSWDYNDSSGLKECMNAQGLYAKISSEPWHWSLTGK